jgi:hypothetical protein
MRKFVLVLLLVAFLFGLAVVVTPVFLRFRPQPAALNQQIFQGVQYERRVTRSPRPMVMHIITIDLQAPGIQLLVTPGDPKAELPLQARTTSQFLRQLNLQVAINGDGFSPWYANHLFSYYPHAGDPVAPIGFAASQGEVYSADTDREPTLYLTRSNRASFRTPNGRIYNALSGNLMLVEAGLIAQLPALEENVRPEPRTAIGIDKNGRRLYLVVVDGRMPGYSEGITLQELAELLLGAGAHFAMNLDGGGSSTLAVQSPGGSPRILNTPIHLGIIGRERPVGNHLGIYASPAEP